VILCVFNTFSGATTGERQRRRSASADVEKALAQSAAHFSHSIQERTKS